MAIRQFAWGVVGSLAVTTLFLGCAQSQPQAQQATEPEAAEQAADEAAVAESDTVAQGEAAEHKGAVQPASATSRLDLKEAPIQRAVATATNVPAGKVPDAAESIGLPAGSLPLEEATDSGQAMPKVVFTEQQAKTSLVNVGDTFPKLELADTAGKPQPFGDLVGQKLTIVVFWHNEIPNSLEELTDLEARFLREFGEQGVTAVGVNVGGDPKLAEELAAQRGAKFPQLCDRDGAALAKLATEKLPRTYLLDASGKVLWFDTEYSRTTRQQLLSAIRFVLKSS